MSLLNHTHRPWVAFDPRNREHRKFYSEFLEKRTWGRCPVRFFIEEDSSGDLVQMIHRKLASYYTQKEFGKIEACKAS